MGLRNKALLVRFHLASSFATQLKLTGKIANPMAPVLSASPANPKCLQESGLLTLEIRQKRPEFAGSCHAEATCNRISCTVIFFPPTIASWY